MNKFKQVPLNLAILFSFFVFVQQSYAANTTMQLTPATGTYDKPFKVNLVIDGQGDRFNAARATVFISEHFAVQDVVLGNCNFSFVSTPTISDLSFQGVILGDSSRKCTVYTATLEPVAKGEGTVKFSNATVRQFGDAQEVLKSATGGTYISTTESTLGVSTNQQLADGLYNLLLTVLKPDGKVLDTGSVRLTSASDSKSTNDSKIDTNGVSTFSNLQEGLYKVEINKDEKKIDENIINVGGKNKVLILSVKVKPQNIFERLMNMEITITPLLLLSVFLGIVAISIGGIAGSKLFKRLRNNDKATTPPSKKRGIKS